ncbi:cartilage intermediate layer protein 1-like isoform X2 [Mercenaria mercenaria]|uniref:cartilage intermediate layer protein 1-like isoform X2 n=1 Tax=Mercenaria mercenaria TaxID=6596 RepID=UPI00234EBC85|nr:cartilage intermediate layer protein 1-like isoform X2 [Mercenaria mercenaria]
MGKGLPNSNLRYIVNRSNTPNELAKENSFVSINETNVNITVKPSGSPHCTKVVIGLVVAGIVAVGVTVALVVVLTKKGDDGEKTTVLPSETPQTTTRPVTSTTTIPEKASTSSGLPSETPETTTVTRPVTSTTMIPEITSTTSENGEGFWSAWGDWTQCTATCNSGIHKRYRSCNGQDSTECVGDFVETEICVETVCPVCGKWTTWGSWGSCDVTCGGGTQSRTRTCSKTDSADLDCVGNNAQEKNCSEWECPDCSRECTVGVLNTDCDTCLCDGMVITGRVRAVSTGNPISNAALYASTAPTKLIAQSNSTGFFSLDAMCTSTELLIIRNGFVDITVVVSDNNIEINMTKIVLPYLTETPQAKKRLSGENVTLCCEAVASPPIDYYEWFKDDLLLDVTLYQDGNKLSLSDLTTTDSGRYQCRANSPAGAIMSPAATLRVKEESNDFCADALQQKTVALPDDCVQARTNTATYEVGECISKSCRENSTTDFGTCREDVSSCCTIGEAVLETVQCSGYELELVVIKSCSCAACSSNSLTISGTALGVEDGSPLKYGEVWVNGIFTTYTSITGDFSFVVSKTSPKVIINLKDTYFRQFLPAIKSVEVNDEMSGVLRVDIGMIQAVEPVEIDSSTENTLVAGASSDNTTTPIVQISIPANAFYYQDGTQYNGTVEASLTFLDPTNTSVLSNIPGTFEIVNEEGQTANLASLAVFNLYFEDSSGQPLILDEVVDLYLPLELGESVTDQDIKLWRMNTETGIWEYVTPGSGTRRRKRQNTALWIGEIDWSSVTDQDWYNYDYVYTLTDRPCYFKVRLFTDQQFTAQVPNPERYIEVDYHILKDSTLLTISDYLYYPENECINAVCEDDNAYISLYYYGRNGYDSLYAGPPEIGSSSHYYEIMDNDKVLKIQMSSSNNGPFYNDRTQCLASSSNNYHLKYHYGMTSEAFTYMKTFTFSPSLGIPESIRISQRTWYPDRSFEGYRVCFMKVRLLFEDGLFLSPGQYIKLKATSYGGTNDEIKDFILGIREHDVTNVTENSSICIEYKCSGTIDPMFDEQSDYTRVVLTLVYPTSEMECNVTGEADFLSSDATSLNEAQIGMTNGTYEIYAPTVYTPDIGLYSATSDMLDIDSAYTTAEGECRSGEPQNIDDDNPETGVAVTFTFKNRCLYWWLWFYNFC